MAIALGGNSINKAYIGTTEIQKMYLGADLVFDNSIQPSELTPIMTNFIVEDASNDKVYFDTPLGYPDGLTTTGFVISNKTINSVTKVDDNGGYFTVSSDFDFWDNTTIRLGEITDTANSQSVLYDFSLEYIENNITEPDASNYRYVSLTGDNGNDGLTEGQAWRTLAYADGQLSAGMTLWVKAGDYGDDRIFFDTGSGGTPTSPIKIIGYKTAIGDGASLNWSYADTSPWSNSNPLAYVNGFDANELPLISGIDEKPSGGDRAIQLRSGNFIIKNIQVQFYDRGFFVLEAQENIWLDNCYAACCTYPIMADNTLTKRFRCTNSVAFRGATNCIRSWGDDALVDNCQLWDDRDDVSEDVNEKYSTDYYIGIEGDNSIFRNNHAERVGNTTHDGHGYSMKGSSSSNEYCLVEKSTIMGINLAIEFSRVNTKYCVAKDVQISRQPETTKADTGGITFLEKATWNLAERILVTDVNQGIFVTPPSDATNNFVRNSIFDNCTMAIRGTGTGQTMEGCTIVNCGSMATEAATWTVIDTILSETSRGSDSLFSYSYCDFHESGAVPSGAGNIDTDPQLDANYLPGVQLEGTPVFGLEYDYDEVERNETTPTIGAMEVDGVTPPVTETDYYVDAVDGLDTNDGLTEQTAWRTISKVNSSTYEAGDVIAFKSGDTFRGLLVPPSDGTDGNPITFTSYGTGSNPIISGADVVSTWTKNATNVWQASVALQPTVVYFDDNRGILRVDSLCSANYEWFWESNILYVYAPNDVDPITTYALIESGARTRALNTNNKVHLTFNNLTFQLGNSLDYPCVDLGGYQTGVVDGVIFDYCTIEKSTRNAIRIRAEVTAGSIGISNCIIKNNGGSGIKFDVGEFASGYVRNCQIYDNGLEGERDTSESSGIEGQLGNLDLHHNEIYDNQVGSPGEDNLSSHGIYTSSTTAVTNIYNNRLSGHLNGRGVKVLGSANVYNNIIYGNNIDGIAVGANESANIIVNIYYNVIYSNNVLGGYNAGIRIYDRGAGTITPSIYNNVFYSNSNTNGYEINLSVDLGGNIAIKNNTTWRIDGRPNVSISTQSGTLDIDNNLHWSDDGSTQLVYGSSYVDFAGWQGLGYDLNGLNDNPDFVTDGTDFNLQVGSPAINAGVDVGLTEDIDGNPIVGVPDMGAYEYQTTPVIEADYYVDAVDGLDTNDGLTPETAWQTLDKVTNTTYEAGDVIALNRGDTFTGRFIQTATTIPITLTAYGTGNKPLLNDATRDTKIILNECSDITIDNLELANSSYTDIRVPGCTNITIQNCTLGNGSTQGILAYFSTYDVTNLVIDSCVFDTQYNTLDSNGADAPTDGVSITSLSGGEIKNNTFINWGHASISLTASDTGPREIKNVKVYNNHMSLRSNMTYGGSFATDRLAYGNEIYNNTFDGTKSIQLNGYQNHFHDNIVKNSKKSSYHAYNEGMGLAFQNYAGQSHDNIVEHNVFDSCANAGIEFMGDNSGNVYGHIVRNNIMINCGLENNNYGINFITNGVLNDNNTIIGNDIYSSATEDTVNYYGVVMTVLTFNTETSHGNTIGGNRYIDPKLNTDYTLQDDSSCINAGYSSQTTTEDYFGNPRPYLTTSPDIGIYEKQSL